MLINGEKQGKWTNEKIIKIELAKDTVNDVEIEVKYKIILSNTSEIAGETDVIENIPEGFELSENNPTYWKNYGNGNLYTTVDLEVGESVELEVILKWKNGESNLGNLNNIVQIKNITNTLNFDDENSEDNYSEARALIVIKTGAARTYIILVLIVTTILISGIVLIKKYVLNINR